MSAIVIPNLLLAMAVIAALAAVCRLPFRGAGDERAGLRPARLDARRQPVSEREAA